MTIAIEYHTNGLFVIPVHSHLCSNKIKAGKAPVRMGWQKERLSVEELTAEISRVYAREGSCNIGIKTGRESNIIVLDVDDISWFFENEMHLGSPVIERRGTGGIHLYYKYPQGFDGNIPTASSGGRVIRGVDILADTTAQVVTYPSIHKSGDQYLLDNNLSLLDVEHEASEPPKWILDELLNKQSVSSEGVMEDRVSENPTDVETARQALRSMKPAVEGQGGDMLTLRAAMMCRDYGLSASRVYELLREEYNPRCTPPWSDSELARKVKNAFTYAKKAQGSMSIETIFSQGDEDNDTSIAEAAAMRYTKKHPVRCARVFLERCGERVKVFDGQVVVYDTEHHRWSLLSDASLEAIIFKDISDQCHGGLLIQEIKMNHISDIRKAVKMYLNRAEEIPDVYWTDSIFEEWGKDCITMGNGILNVANGDFYDHTPHWFSFHSLPMNYDGQEQCPTFLRFLNDIWDNDNEMIESLRLWMGYCLLNRSDLQRFALFKGASRAGKGTLVKVIENMLGSENVASSSLSLIGSDFGLQPLVGKKLCVFQDADRASPDRTGVATERIKSLSANDSIGINRKGMSVVNQRLNTKIIFVCNRLPSLLNDENSLTNRMIVFPFYKSYQGVEDFNLSEKLDKETIGILNWALVGARKLLRGEKLFTAPKGLEMLKDVGRQLDSVEAFMHECVEVTGQNHNFVSNKAIWDAYKNWCKESNRGCKNRQRFMNHLVSEKLKGLERRSNNVRGFVGVRLQEEPTFSLEDSDVPF